jgi:hypothetical protein
MIADLFHFFTPPLNFTLWFSGFSSRYEGSLARENVAAWRWDVVHLFRSCKSAKCIYFCDDASNERACVSEWVALG